VKAGALQSKGVPPLRCLVLPAPKETCPAFAFAAHLNKRNGRVLFLVRVGDCNAQATS
jgi:hypothetical protein